MMKVHIEVSQSFHLDYLHIILIFQQIFISSKLPVGIDCNKNNPAVCVDSFISNKPDFQIVKNSRLVQVR